MSQTPDLPPTVPLASDESKGEQAYQEAMALLQKFVSQPDRDRLQLLAYKFLQAFDAGLQDGRPFVGLAYVFYAVDELELTYKYLNLADLIQPGLPETMRFRRLLERSREAAN